MPSEPEPSEPESPRRSYRLSPADFDPVDAVQKLLEDRPIPDTLHHYTGSAGLVGIVSTKTLRLSHLRFLNDTSEMDYARKVIEIEITRYATDNTSVADFLKGVEKELDKRIAEVDLFGACFCEHRDLLSQWRGYSKGGGVYAIGFSSVSLDQSRSDDDGDRHSLVPILYEPEEQRQLVRKVLAKGANRQLIRKVGLKLDPTRDEMLRYTAAALSLCVLMLKDSSFRAEQEWRILYARQPGDKKIVKFRAMPWYPWPYVELAFHASRVVGCDLGVELRRQRHADQSGAGTRVGPTWTPFSLSSQFASVCRMAGPVRSSRPCSPSSGAPQRCHRWPSPAVSHTVSTARRVLHR